MGPFNYPWDVCLAQLEGTDWDFLPDPRNPEQRAEAKACGLQVLRQLSGQDFGEDVTAWREWLEANPERWLQGLRGRKITPEEMQQFYLSRPELIARRSKQ